MSRFFVDAVHFIALANPNDQWHERSVHFANTLAKESRFTTEEVLTEFLNFYAESGEYMRTNAAEITKSVLLDPLVEIISPSETSFLIALDLYESRPDKGYSLTDCI